MHSRYYSVRLFVDKYPNVICCRAVLDIADKISEIIGCRYERFGYTLLDPAYDFKDLGIMLQNTPKNREKFLEMVIPLRVFDENEMLPSAPFVFFERETKNDNIFPSYRIQLEYPVNNSAYLSVQIDIKDDLITKPISMEVLGEIHDVLKSKGYETASSFIDYYSGEARRIALNGGESGIITRNDWQIIDHAIKFREMWKNKVLDVFLVNAFDKKMISKKSVEKIMGIVGKENCIEHDEKIIFRLPQSPKMYLLNRLISVKSRKEIRQVLQEEKVCYEDPSFLASILRL